MTHSEWSEIYYEKLRGMETTVEELEQLKETRIKQIAQIEQKGDKSQYSVAQHYMAQVEAIERLLRERQTTARARDAWRAMTTPESDEPEQPMQNKDKEEDDFDAFLASLSEQEKVASQPKKKEMTREEADAYFAGAESRSAWSEQGLENTAMHDVQHDALQEHAADGWEEMFGVPANDEAREQKGATDKGAATDTAHMGGAKNKNMSSVALTPSQRRRRTAGRIFFWLPIALLILGIVIVGGHLFVLPAPTYFQAKKAFANGEYTKAKDLYEQLPGVWRVSDNIISCDYAYAQQLLDNGNFADAKTAFAALSGYEDADEKCKECDYRLALQYQTLEQYDNAIPLFEALGDYQDCRTRLADCYYQQGLQYCAQGQFDQAQTAFTSYASYTDSETAKPMLAYAEAMQAAAQGNLQPFEDLQTTLDETQLEALRQHIDLDALYASVAQFEETYADYLGTYESNTGSRTVTLSCVLQGEAKLCYTGDFMPSGTFIPTQAYFGPVNEEEGTDEEALYLTIDDGSGTMWELVLTLSRNTLTVNGTHGENSFEYMYTRTNNA